MTHYCRKGYGSSKPLYAIHPDTGEVIPLNLPADAVMPEAKPGAKSGIPYLDEINEELRQKGLIKRIKKLYDIEKGRIKNK